MTEYTRTTYVELNSGGTYHANSGCEVSERSLVATLKHKTEDHHIRYCFYDVLSTTVTLESGRKVTLRSLPIDVSVDYYFRGKVFSLEEIKTQFPKDQILISEVEKSESKMVIHLPTGQWKILAKGAVVLEEG